MSHNAQYAALVAFLATGVFVAGCSDRNSLRAHGAPVPGEPVATSQPALSTLPADAWIAVAPSTLRQYAPAVGTLRARQVTQIGPLVSGRVAEVAVDVGDVVKLGQVLVHLERPLFEIELRQQEAGVAAARGALAGANADANYWAGELRRQEDLFARGVGSQKELDDARTKNDQAAAALAASEGRLAQAEQLRDYARQRLSETEIVAPYNAVITQRYVDPGDMAASTPPTDLLELREIDVLYLEFSLPQELLGVVRAGSEIEFTVEGMATDAQAGVVDVIFPALEEATRSVRCRALVDNADRHLMPGALVQVRVVRQEAANALVVPREALRQTADGWEVFVDADGRPIARPVKVGLMTDGGVQLLDGVAPGERVLASAQRAG